MILFLFLSAVGVSAGTPPEGAIINLRIKSLPESSLIYINDTLFGCTPFEMLRPAGGCTLKVVQAGFLPVIKEITLDARNNSYNFKLIPAPVVDEIPASQHTRNLILSGILTTVLAGVWAIQYGVREKSGQNEGNPELAADYRRRAEFYRSLSLLCTGASAGLFTAGLARKYLKKN